MGLTGKQRRFLRALAHHRKPTVQVGVQGLTEAVAKKTKMELEVHELIKVKVSEHCAGEKKEIAAQLAEQTDSELAQVLGRTIVLYRKRDEDPEIRLPRGK
jgi:RNA-binding protein